MRGLADGVWQRAGYCLPNGKVIALFWLHKDADGYVLALPDALAETVMRRLQMFVLRSKVRIERHEERFCALPVAQGGVFAFCIGDEAPADALDADDFFAACIRARVAEIFAPTSGEFLPQMLALPETGALSFTKGCYVGQEAVARLQYKGANRRVLGVANAALPAVPAAGDELFAGALRAATVLMAARDGGTVWVQAVVQDRFLDTDLFGAESDIPLRFHHHEEFEHGKT